MQNKGLRRSRSFKVTDVGTNRKHVCDFLLVINTKNWHPISYRFEVIADIVSILEEKRSRGLGATYTIYLRLIIKFVVDFLSVLIERFATCYGWGATSEYWLEIGVFEGGGSVSANLHVKGGVSDQSFSHG